MKEAASNAPLWTAAEATAATGGRTNADWAATGVSIDSRTIEKGDLFVALAGPNHDGHRFVCDALRKGAAAALIDQVPEGEVSDKAPLIVVDNTLHGLEGLARAARARSSARIVAVTGSAGKTGTKEALRRVFTRFGLVHASAASHNNLWGVPLSIARMRPETDYGVFEIGMNHAGEILPLTRIARPNVAVITNIEAVHLAHFSSVRDIASAKAEIFDGVEPGGVAVLNRDNPFFHLLAERARECGIDTIYSFGSHPESTVQILKSVQHANCSCITANVDGRLLTYKVGIPGLHWVQNSAAVLATVAALDQDIGLAGLALANLRPLSGRGRRHEIDLGDGSFELVDDSYNANPASMRAAFDAMSRRERAPGRRRIAVLGDMLELGEGAERLHAELADALIAARIDKVYCVGPLMRALYDAVPGDMRGDHQPDSLAMVPVVAKSVMPGDVVLVKGSFGSRMGPIVEALRALGGSAKRAANG